MKWNLPKFYRTNQGEKIICPKIRSIKYWISHLKWKCLWTRPNTRIKRRNSYRTRLSLSITLIKENKKKSCSRQKTTIRRAQIITIKSRLSWNRITFLHLQSHIQKHLLSISHQNFNNKLLHRTKTEWYLNRLAHKVKIQHRLTRWMIIKI